ncbi:protein Niban 1a [Antennarius striatus]|uniref:protein Niban 1a n=1 Tax=Antennarius striatus TaxID=241820 RepID=UPI0035B44E8C
MARGPVLARDPLVGDRCMRTKREEEEEEEEGVSLLPPPPLLPQCLAAARCQYLRTGATCGSSRRSSMGISPSSLLDETRSSYIRDEAEVELKNFSPYFRKQFAVAHFCQVEEDLENHEEKKTQLLKQMPALEEGEVLYEEGLFYFDETRKWRERYVVVRANYCLECHESLETFIKGVPPRQKLLPTGGTVLTTEDKYMAMVDKCFPDDSSVEDFAPPLTGMLGQFPVYLRLPYRRDSYFCFNLQDKQEAFISILCACIRHQNQDFLKKSTCEVQAFLKAIQLYRQDRGRYEAWDMLIGSDVRVMGNLVMERLLPSLEKDMLPRLKAKKTEKKRVWFATMEAAYILAQEHLLERLSALKEECRTSTRQQEVLMHSDMDQILKVRGQLEDKVQDKVSAPAEKLCSESVQPHLEAVLEQLMEPISSGFQEGRKLSGQLMEEVCQDLLLQDDIEQLKKVLARMARPDLLRCYQKIGSLRDKQHHLLDLFGFSNTTAVIHSAQIDLQQLMENAAFTFEQLLYKAFDDHPDDPHAASAAITKARHIVLKHFDYDSSTVRKRICREALIAITLPFIKKNLAPICKAELQGLDQSIDADHANFIHVENIYEDILLQILDQEVSKVVKEAANLEKFNLITDSRDFLSRSNRSSLSSPSISTPSSPAMAPATLSKPPPQPQPQPPSPLAVNGLASYPQGEEPQETDPLLLEEASVETIVGGAEQKEAGRSVGDVWEAEPDVQTVGVGDTQVGTTTAATAEDLIQLEEPEGTDETQNSPAPAGGGTETGAEAPGPDGETGTSIQDQMVCESPETQLEAPPSGQMAAGSSPDPLPVPEPKSPDEPMASKTSDLDSTPEEVKGSWSCEDERSVTSDLLEDEANISMSPVSPNSPGEDRTDPDPQAQKDAVGAEPTAEATKEETVSSPQAPPPDSIREIRDLVVEVIEVEELLQRYPEGIPKDE